MDKDRENETQDILLESKSKLSGVSQERRKKRLVTIQLQLDSFP